MLRVNHHEHGAVAAGLLLLCCVHSAAAATCITTKTVCKPIPFPAAFMQAAAAAPKAAADKQRPQQAVGTRRLLENDEDVHVGSTADLADLLAGYEARYRVHALQPDAPTHQAVFWSHAQQPQVLQQQQTLPQLEQPQGRMEHTLPAWGQDSATESISLGHRTLLAEPQLNAVISETAVRNSPTLAPPPAPAPAPFVLVGPPEVQQLPPRAAPPPAPPIPVGIRLQEPAGQHSMTAAAGTHSKQNGRPIANSAAKPGTAGTAATAGADARSASEGTNSAVKRRRRHKPQRSPQVLVSPKVALYAVPSPSPKPLANRAPAAQPRVPAAVPAHRATVPPIRPSAIGPVAPMLGSSAVKATVSPPAGFAGTEPAKRSAPASAAKPHAAIPTVRGHVRHSPDGVIFVSHSKVIVGIDPNHGGAIMYLSSPALPAWLSNMNLVNIFDAGRLIQQSYYGCYDGSCWFDRTWRWNPVQGGSWQHQLPRIVQHRVDEAKGTVHVAVNPRNWAGQELLEDVHMITNLSLWEHGVKVHYTMQYTGKASHPTCHQEVPAVYVTRKLGVLATYTGSKPWSSDSLSFLEPGEQGQYYKPTERWAAYLESKSGYGVGVYSPVATQLVSYRVGPDGSGARMHCSYFAPIITAKVQPHTEFSYDVYIAVGQIDDLRHWFGQVAATVDHGTLKVQRKFNAVAVV